MRTVQRLLLATSTAPGVATAIWTPATTSASTPNTEAVTTILAISAPSSLLPTLTSTVSSNYQVSTIVSTTSSESNTTTPTTTTTSNKTRSTLATKLGLGLGIPLLVLVVLGITACAHRRQRNRQRQRAYAQAPPFEFNAPEVPPVSAADLAARQDQQQREQREQREQQRHSPPRRSDHPWLAEWGDPAGGTGGGPYDDNQVGFVGPLGFQGYYQGYQVPWEEEGADLGGDLGSPRPRQDQQHYPYLQQWDRGGAIEDLALHGNQGHLSEVHILQVPVIQVRQPEQVPPEHQRRSVRVRISGGLNSGFDEVSPLSSSGSGPPYARVSAISRPG